MRRFAVQNRLAAAVVASLVGAIANAQSLPRGIVRVTARDSTGTPVAQAELTIRHGLQDVLARGTTDSAGRGILSVEVKDSTDMQVTMRKIGYARGDRFFSVAPHDTTFVTITVSAPGQSLAAVKVTAPSGDPRWNSYHLDADEIEQTKQPLLDAWDMVKKLRPVMLTSRGGCETGIQDVWVNGKRIRLPLRPIGTAAIRANVGAPLRARYSYIPVSVLSDIAPEHIQELTYHDCFDTSMAAVGNNNALFVVLKPGIMYVQDVGSFVIDTSADTALAKPRPER
jgi:hypothetical protein